MSDTTVFCSLFPYALSKQWATEAWPDALRSEIDRPTWPCFRTLEALRSTFPVALTVDVDAGLAKSRSRAVGQFLRSGADVWLSCDDDVEASAAVVARLVESARELDAIVGAAYVGRVGSHRAIGEIPPDAAPMPVHAGGLVVPAWKLGGGLVAASRHAVGRMADAFPELQFEIAGDRPGQWEVSVALFQEFCASGKWISEDIAFCSRAHSAGVPRYLLLDAEVTHAGAPFSLDVAALEALRARP